MDNQYNLMNDLEEHIYKAVFRALQEVLNQGAQPTLTQWGSRHDAAVLASMSLPTIHALINQGLIVSRKVGRRTLINLTDLREKLASGEISKYHHPNKK